METDVFDLKGDYLIPGKEKRCEILVVNSRFIADVAPVFSVEEARRFIAKIKAEFRDASHHVPAYLIGYGNNVVSHCSDDGEPSGTAGKPILAVISGSGFGDIVLVVTRYFGGTKLGTGGLVRAYTSAAKAVLDAVPRAIKIAAYVVKILIPYSFYQPVVSLLSQYYGIIQNQDFSADVSILVRIPLNSYDLMVNHLMDLTNGQAKIENSGNKHVAIYPKKN